MATNVLARGIDVKQISMVMFGQIGLCSLVFRLLTLTSPSLEASKTSPLAHQTPTRTCTASDVLVVLERRELPLLSWTSRSRLKCSVSKQLRHTGSDQLSHFKPRMKKSWRLLLFARNRFSTVLKFLFFQKSN